MCIYMQINADFSLQMTFNPFPATFVAPRTFFFQGDCINKDSQGKTMTLAVAASKY